jgi:hypothetical protein
MNTFLLAMLFVITGLASATLGYALFRLLLPLMGFIVGMGVGFSGIQAIFGTNVWSFFAATITALIIGLIFGVVAYLYYTLGVIVLFASIVSGIFAFLGQAVGLREEGFIVFLLGLSGAIIGGIVVLRYRLQNTLIIFATALFGVSLILSGILLVSGGISITQLHENGILQTIEQTVETSWIWIFALAGATIFAAAFQRSLIERAIGDYSRFVYVEESKK